MNINRTKNPKVLNDYLDYLQKIKNYSAITQYEYYLNILCFFRFIKEYMNIDVSIKEFNIFLLAKVQQSDIVAFLIYLNLNRENTGSTRQRKIMAIRSFYKWLIYKYSYKIQITNPTDELEHIKVVQRIPKCLNLKQAKEIRNIYTKGNTKYPERNNLIISLFLNTGLRLSELVSLNIGDINFENKYIKVIGKGNKERKVFMNESIKEQLLNYLKTQNRNNNYIDLEEPLFKSQKKQRLGRREVQTICNKAFELIGLKE